MTTKDDGEDTYDENTGAPISQFWPVIIKREFQAWLDGIIAERFKLKTRPPTASDIQDENFTGGLRSEEYLDKLRRGEV